MKSPENLDQYIRVLHVSGWIILLSVLFILIGAIIWGCFGTIETKIHVQAFVSDGTAVCSVPSDNTRTISSGMILRVENTNGSVWSVEPNKSVIAKIDIPDGVYNAEIITEVIKPMSLIFD